MTGVKFFRGLLIVGLLVFSACIRYEKVAKTEFPQGQEHDDKRDVTFNYVRSATIYDQFETKAIFDTLWLSDEVRSAFIDIYCRKRGIEGDAREALLKRQLEENKHWIMFYLLTDIREKAYVTLSEKHSSWTVFIDGKNPVVPESIKEVDIEPEYKYLFGQRFNDFKNAFLIKFPKKGLSGVEYAPADEPLTFVVSSAHKKKQLVWDPKTFKKKSELKKNEDFYWC